MKKHLPRRAADYGGGASGFTAYLVFRTFRLAIPVLYWLSQSADGRRRYTAGGLPKNYLAITTKSLTEKEVE